ncbi:MAG: rhomboid family intramembrane serine protease [Acidobacteriota bacterium]
MFPLRDSIPSSRAPVVNIVLIASCVAVFIFELLLGSRLDDFVRAFALIPARLFDPAAYGVSLGFNLKSLFLSMFLHGGWLHLIGNMWFLWIFGDNVEDCLGHGRYLVFYLGCGLLAALGQAIVAPSSVVPMIGASGAIAGVLGAYLVWFPWARVKTLLFLFIIFTIVEIPAPIFLVLWFVVQFFSGTLSLASAGAASGGVAFFAHVGGFVSGAGIAWWLRHSGGVRPCTRNYNAQLE